MNPTPQPNSVTSMPIGAHLGLAPRDVEMIGLLSGVVFAVSLVPQIQLVIRNRSAKDLSYAWLWLELLAVLISLFYYFLHSAWSALLTGLVEGLATVLLLCLKWHYAQNPTFNAPDFKDSTVSPVMAAPPSSWPPHPRRDSLVWVPPPEKATVGPLSTMGTQHARRSGNGPGIGRRV
ncbi:hypothetical protein BCR44DRAFT_74090 [Catenaria anguillulae PL171]|uniref:PQ loop repeat-domain-containing protein n=1 Tax=Catenaria anguillulae PL171 TaxID=765915 RepID=A0A1Y2HE87_9FUNG|nr:hypothetical protein BCR44DRAFT_74090 [Catenaria anguillulae PL171]